MYIPYFLLHGEKQSYITGNRAVTGGVECFLAFGYCYFSLLTGELSENYVKMFNLKLQRIKKNYHIMFYLLILQQLRVNKASHSKGWRMKCQDFLVRLKRSRLSWWEVACEIFMS